VKISRDKCKQSCREETLEIFLLRYKDNIKVEINDTTCEKVG
jgi:hypothetical protein